MSIDTNLIIGNTQSVSFKSNPINIKIEAVKFLNSAEELEKNIEETQRFATKIGEPLRGSNIDIFG